MVRLTRIYTRTGDDGTTRLVDNSKVAKTDARLQAYADVDEANASIGLALALGAHATRSSGPSSRPVVRRTPGSLVRRLQRAGGAAAFVRPSGRDTGGGAPA